MKGLKIHKISKTRTIKKKKMKTKGVKGQDLCFEQSLEAGHRLGQMMLTGGRPRDSKRKVVKEKILDKQITLTIK